MGEYQTTKKNDFEHPICTAGNVENWVPEKIISDIRPSDWEEIKWGLLEP